MADVLTIEVVYALPQQQELIAVQLPRGSTLAQAVVQSGLLAQYPELSLERTAVGIFGRQCAADTVLEDGDRVELYRPLQVDPKARRRRRARTALGRR